MLGIKGAKSQSKHKNLIKTQKFYILLIDKEIITTTSLISLTCKYEVEMKFFYTFWYLFLYWMVMQEMGKPCPPIHGEVTGAADTAALAYVLCPLYRLPQLHTQIL